jgi:hypothetical protein
MKNKAKSKNRHACERTTKLTSKSIMPRYANKMAAKTAIKVRIFLVSLIVVITGIEPICQSWLSVDGQRINHQLKAAR